MPVLSRRRRQCVLYQSEDLFSFLLVIHSCLCYFARRMTPTAHSPSHSSPVPISHARCTHSPTTLASADIPLPCSTQSGRGGIPSMPSSPGNAKCHVSPVCRCT